MHEIVVVGHVGGVGSAGEKGAVCVYRVCVVCICVCVQEAEVRDADGCRGRGVGAVGGIGYYLVWILSGESVFCRRVGTVGRVGDGRSMLPTRSLVLCTVYRVPCTVYRELCTYLLVCLSVRLRPACLLR